MAIDEDMTTLRMARRELWLCYGKHGELSNSGRIAMRIIVVAMEAYEFGTPEEWRKEFANVIAFAKGILVQGVK
jgi:hypothetical protein